jgi:autotransporter-associated beta strand protein
MNRHIVAAICCLLTFTLSTAAYAISAQWDLDPISGDWNTAANWTPNGIPNGPADTATFGLSNTTDVSISANTEVNSIIFALAATNPYTITSNAGLMLTISGVGIVNSSGIAQKFVTAVDVSGDFGRIVFTNSATAGTSTFTNRGSVANFVQGGETAFFDTSSAANGTFVNKGGTGFGSQGGRTVFHDYSTAGNANFTNRAGMGVGTSVTFFLDTSTAANGTFTNEGGGTGGAPFAEGGQTIFRETSTAANGTFVNNGATANGAFGGATVFDDSSTAGSGTFVNNGGAASGVAALGGGNTIFFADSNAANGTFINNAAPASGAEGGVTEFETAFSSNNASPSAGNGTFINNGATVGGAVGGKTVFYESSTADAATLIANGGINGGRGGAIFFEEESTGGTARIEVFGNGFLDISGHFGRQGVTIGSTEGDGDVFLGANNLTVGSNDLSTTFSGVLQDGGTHGGAGGALTKIGSGTLILSGANTYTGNTNVKNRGVLQVDGSINSNTFVRGHSVLAGTGTIYGNVTNTNTGIVRPGGALGAPGVLTLVHNYTQTQYANLMIQIAGTSANDFSVLNVLGNASLNGYLDPVLLNGFVPTVGDSFVFLNYASFTGAFSHIRHEIFGNGMLQWAVTYENTRAILTVESRAIVPDQGSTFLLLTLGFLGLVAYRRQLLHRRP